MVLRSNLHRTKRVTTLLHSTTLLVVFLAIGSLSYAQQVGRSVAQMKTLCKTQEMRCIADIRLKDWERSRRSCDACYTSCIATPLRTDAESQKNAEQCLKQCVAKNCGNGPSGRDPLKGVFACRYHGRHCYHDFNNNSPSISVSCPKCVSLCPPFDTIGRNDTQWCSDRCDERNCLRSNAPTIATTPTPSASVGTTSSPKPIPEASRRKSGIGPWEWLGPVLGAVATIAGAVITVVWVRDFRHPRPLPSADQSQDWVDPTQPSSQSDASYGWGVANIQTPQSWSGIGAPPLSNLPSAPQEYATSNSKF